MWDGTRTRTLAAGLAACLIGAAGCLSPSQAAADDISFFRIATGSIGGTYFPVGSMLANAISSPPGSPSCEQGGSCGVPGLVAIAQASSGSAENVRLIGSGAVESGLSQADIAYWAATGTGLFEGQPPLSGLRAIATLYTEAVQVVVPADSPAQSLADLRGKRVSLGVEGSGVLVDSRLLLDAYGMTEADVQPVHEPPEVSADLIADGRLDAMVFIGGVPVLAIADLARRTPIRLLPLADDAIAALRQRQQFFTTTTIAADTYHDVPAVDTLGVGALWLVGADVDADLVHDATAAIWNPNVRALFDNGHPRGKDIRLENALRGLSVPLHQGAERYYREIGMLRDTGAPVDTPATPDGAAAP